ncbi:MAG: dihydrofolate reductase [Ruminococcus sp.]|nr:dihydrofolate reductase [Ruminococcus sp.]
MISIIAAVSRNGVIGADGKIPWDIPEDMAYFSRTTTGGAVIMGRRTYEDIGRPLPKRYNIILSAKLKKAPEGTVLADSLEKAIELAKNSGRENIFLCGGSAVYREGLAIADRIYLTVIDRDYEGNVFFPKFSEKDFRLTSCEKCLSAPISFRVYDRCAKL